MRRTIIGVACALLIAAAIAQDDIDFKGVAFGSSEQDFVAKQPGYRCEEALPRFRAGGDRICIAFGKPDRPHEVAKTSAGTFAGVPSNVMVKFYDNKLAGASVSFF